MSCATLCHLDLVASETASYCWQVYGYEPLLQVASRKDISFAVGTDTFRQGHLFESRHSKKEKDCSRAVETVGAMRIKMIVICQIGIKRVFYQYYSSSLVGTLNFC